MIQFQRGNLLEAKVEALVNTVNCVGVMGKGIALQFKQAFPENFKQYQKACNADEVKPGQMFTVATGNLFNPRYIINFPTKRHWKEKSKLEDIKAGLGALVVEVQRLGIRSIAIPPLGCGNGGLDWAVVKPLIVDTFVTLPDVEVMIFEPGGAPTADEVQVNTSKPPMTRARALVISLFDRYGVPGYRLGRLEAQKLVYLLQEAGEVGLKLEFKKHQYGPYAEKLNHALQRIDGHYIRGYGDRSQHSQLYVLPEGRQAAETFLAEHEDAHPRLERVSRLIAGFETPYGMEMLATVHWVAKHNPEAAVDRSVAITEVQGWSDRKRNLFKLSHLQKAWQRLKEQGWLD
jgi:O-acetyl-ADP-ribose deacetylase (regulator of RNase III)